jgi:hypothetical protein
MTRCQCAGRRTDSLSTDEAQDLPESSPFAADVQLSFAGRIAPSSGAVGATTSL